MAILMAVVWLPPTAHGKDYKVEVLLFENVQSSRASERHDYIAPEVIESTAPTWGLKPSMLVEAAQAVKDSPDFALQHHFSWGQESLPLAQSATFAVIEQDVRGHIKVYADQLLFVSIDLDYQGFRMTEKRRLKLNEKHFFDHPKFGLLLQVSRLEADVPAAENATNPELESSR